MWHKTSRIALLVLLLVVSPGSAQDLFVGIQTGVSGWQASRGVKSSYPRSPVGMGVTAAVRRGTLGLLVSLYDPKRSDMGTEDGSYLNPAYVHLGALLYPTRFFRLGGGLSVMRYTERIDYLLRRGDERGRHTSTNLGYFFSAGFEVAIARAFTAGAEVRYDLHFRLNSSFPPTANQAAHTSTVQLVIGRYFSL